MHNLLNRYFFILEQTDNGLKTKCVVEFKGRTLEAAKQEYEEVLGWCGGYEILQIVERNADEPYGSGFLTSLLVSSGNS